jgi:hypothetical protein
MTNKNLCILLAVPLRNASCLGLGDLLIKCRSSKQCERCRSSVPPSNFPVKIPLIVNFMTPSLIRNELCAPFQICLEDPKPNIQTNRNDRLNISKRAMKRGACRPEQLQNEPGRRSTNRAVVVKSRAAVAAPHPMPSRRREKSRAVAPPSHANSVPAGCKNGRRDA